MPYRGCPQPLMFLGGAMSRNRNIGTIAALGGLTAVVALLTGLPSASADELSDAQAKNQLLQQRLDQLAQAPPVSPVGFTLEARQLRVPAPALSVAASRARS